MDFIISIFCPKHNNTIDISGNVSAKNEGLVEQERISDEPVSDDIHILPYEKDEIEEAKRLLDENNEIEEDNKVADEMKAYEEAEADRVAEEISVYEEAEIVWLSDKIKEAEDIRVPEEIESDDDIEVE